MLYRQVIITPRSLLTVIIRIKTKINLIFLRFFLNKFCECRKFEYLIKREFLSVLIFLEKNTVKGQLRKTELYIYIVL